MSPSFSTLRRRRVVAFFFLAGSAVGAMAQTAVPSPAPITPATSATPFVAGLAPYERPQGAPVLLEPLPEATRAQWATHGISDPVPPAILAFVKNQGAWYTPFSHPGMTGRYDIRGWHTESPKPEKR